MYPIEGDIVGVEIGVGAGVAGTGFSVTWGEIGSEEGTRSVFGRDGYPRCSSGDVVPSCESNGPG